MQIAKSVVMQAEESSDDVSISNLIRTVWDGKWLVGLATVLLGALGTAYITFFPPALDGTLEISPLQDVRMASYLSLRNLQPSLLKSDVQEGQTSVLDPALLKIDAQLLVNNLVSVLAEQSVFAEAAEAIVSKSSTNSDSTAQVVSSLLRSLNVTRPSVEGERVVRPNWTISLSARNSIEGEAILLEALRRAEIEANLRANKAINDLKNFYTNSLTEAKQDVELIIETEKENYTKLTLQRIASLTENEQIARSLGISKDTVGPEDYAVGGTTVAVLESTKPEYMRGYEALSKQINLMKSRSDPELFMPALIPLIARRRELEGDRFIERLDRAVAESPLGVKPAGQNLAPSAQYVVSSTTWSSDRRPMLLAVSLLLGLFLGVVVVFLRSALRNKA
jgi:LPS O-antigen subunit length determinant protein (WzzB/FepE family)